MALTLRLLGGLTTEEIARAFLVPEPTVAQRIVRAKRTLAEARVPFEVPRARARRAAGVGARGRLPGLQRGVLGHRRRRLGALLALCDALRLGRILAELAPREPEVHGLVALMEIQASRLRARVGPSGDPILLLDQDRGRWDQLLIRRGSRRSSAPRRWASRWACTRSRAAIAACQRARTGDETDWERIVALYDGLAEVAPRRSWS